MTVAIELDVPLDVVDEMTERIFVLPCAREGLLKSAEHLRADVLAAVKEGRSDPFPRRGLSQRHRMLDEGLDMRRYPGPHHSRLDRSTDPRHRAKRVELAGAGADVRHGAGGKVGGGDNRRGQGKIPA